ncbi:MAG: hypothetical protein HYW48_12275 [Deltaproteobacteria bacterium]|nr:hypothetical protein [Deltaproteobacteria bacterium]
MSIFIIFTYGFRIATLRWNLSRTELYIPSLVTEENIEAANSPYFISESSIAILFHENAFYFGNLEGFGRSLKSGDQKFYIPHIKEQPQLEELGTNLKALMGTVLSDHKLAILIPAANVDITKVIKVVDYLRSSQIFDTVILGGGLI